MVDTERLRAVIKQSGLKKSFLAAQLSLSRQSFSARLSGSTDFRVREILKLREVLQLSSAETEEIFLR